jgi:hypothetical protein
MKPRTYNELKKHGVGWIDELPAVVWANRTTPSRATGETPFFLVYGAEAVLPAKVTLGSPQVRAYNEEDQDQLRQHDILYLEEVRCRLAVRVARYQQALRCYHQRHVRPRTLQVGDLVLHRFQSREGRNKLSAMWEGLFHVMEERRPRAFRFSDEDGVLVPNV